MKKEKQVRENGKAVSPKPQPKTPACRRKFKMRKDVAAK
jgi:hypothetical protein